MRIAVHDFAGHPFQVQLSRELARRGHDVLHVHCASFQGAKGALAKTKEDPDSFASIGIRLPGGFDKYSGLKRIRQERAYGRLLLQEIAAFGADRIVSSNTPLFAQQVLMRGHSGARFLFWQQDIYGVAMQKILRKRIPVVGGALGSVFPLLERTLLRRADEVVVIAEDFRAFLADWKVAEDHIHVIENWAPLGEIEPLPRDNAWAREHGLVGKQVFLYAGTLGLKHNPELLLELARTLQGRTDAEVVVVSEGLGASWLADRLAQESISTMRILPFQPYEQLSSVLASGDVLITLLEADASIFSVPSKVLSYLCAGRPILGAIPPENLAAKTIERSGAGRVVVPENAAAFAGAAIDLMSDEGARERSAEAARRYAEATFDIESIADKFERLLLERRIDRDAVA